MQPSTDHPHSPRLRPSSPKAKRSRFSAIVQDGDNGDEVTSAAASNGRTAKPGKYAEEGEVQEHKIIQVPFSAGESTYDATAVPNGVVVSLLDHSPSFREPRSFPILPSSIASCRRAVPVPKAVAPPPSICFTRKEVLRLPLSPQAAFTYVDSKAVVTAAFQALSLCNVFAFDVKYNRVNLKKVGMECQPIRDTRTNLGENIFVIDGVARCSPSILVVVGTCLDNLRPDPCALCIDVEDAQASEMVYLFDLMVLLPSHGASIDAGLSPLLVDPEKLIVGLDIESELRLLARVYADWVPCFGRTVNGIKDIGTRCIKKSGVDMKKPTKFMHLLAQFTGFQISVDTNRYLWAERPVCARLISAVANNVMGLLNVYRIAGSEALGGTEKTLDLGTVDVFKCCACEAICFDRQMAPNCNNDCCNAVKDWNVPSQQVLLSQISISDERLSTLELRTLQFMVARGY